MIVALMSARTHRTGLACWVAVILQAVALPTLSACQICLPFPTQSLADGALAAEHLALARESPDQPFTLAPVSVLEPANGPLPPMELFLDSAARRQLSLDPSRHILCGWMPEEQEWRRLAFHDEVTAPVIRDILANREAWEADPAARADYFADHLASEATVLSDLAHIEVARAPYAQITRYGRRLPREELRRRLGNVRRMEWHALYILLLAQSEHPDDQMLIRERVESGARWAGTMHTAAWATALIEIDGDTGIERLAELFLSGTERSSKELAAIHAALRVHADEGRPELRDPVVALYGKLLERSPGLAPDLADDLTKWQRFDHAAAFVALLKEAPQSFDLAATSRIRAHLRAADPVTRSTSRPKPVLEEFSSGAVFALVGGLLILVIAIPWAGRLHHNQPTNEHSPALSKPHR